MREITKLKDRFCRQYALHCDKVKNSDIFSCTLGDQCSCRLAAEVQAYLYTILPQDYQRFNIFDFDGKNADAKELLKKEKVLEVKAKISTYCWGMSFDELKNIHKDGRSVDKFSIMDRRKRRGDCVVIGGNVNRQSGRTLTASIILREAIKRRFCSNANALQTYEWLEFPNLKMHAKNRDDTLTDYQYADWLVVDNFTEEDLDAPRNVKSYIISLLDPFFITRFEMNLPTILVFRFKIADAHVAIQETFGVGVDRILNNSRTTKIDLS